MSKPTNDEIRVAVAEVLDRDEVVIYKPAYGMYYRKDAGGYTGDMATAWRVTPEQAKKYTMYVDVDPMSNAYSERVIAMPAPAPDYPNDLNACAAMEEWLCDTGNINDPDHPRYAYSRCLYRIVPVSRQPMRATALQRCEAFLRTVGKWTWD